MKSRHYLFLILVGLTAFFGGFVIGKNRTEKPPGGVTETVETTVDTVVRRMPVQRDVSAAGTRRFVVPTYCFLGTVAERDSVTEEPQCSADSALVELPIVQRHYADSAYEAWVSGPIDPQLDSVRVFAPTTVVTRQEWKPPKRWHIGPTVGFGYTPRGLEPFIGISLTYSIIAL